MSRISIMLIFLFNLSYCQTVAKVIGIKDGDTIIVLDQNSIQITLRLAEVDCPESGQPYGKNAKQFTSGQVFGKIVKYYKISSDRYGRIIAKVYYSDGKYLSEEIIKTGFGWWYFRYSNNINLGKLQEKAQTNKLGLWGDPYPVEPWNYRKSK